MREYVDSKTGQMVQSSIYSGDLLLFGGHGFISNVIKFFTDKTNHAVSHCAVMISPTLLVESTSLNGQNGVTEIDLDYWVRNYPGEIWVRHLVRSAQRDLNYMAFKRFLKNETGRPYDKFQAFLAGLGIETPDAYGAARKWYCSEIATAAYIAGGILPPGASVDLTPAELGRLPIFGPAHQIKGRIKQLL